MKKNINTKIKKLSNLFSLNKKFIYLFFSIFVIVYITFSDNGIIELYKNKIILYNLNNDIELLKIKNSQLSDNINKYENNPFYIERFAREKLGLAKPNEIIYRDIDSSN